MPQPLQLAPGILVASLLIAAVASAQAAAPLSEADHMLVRELTNEGTAALARKDYATAADRFAGAFAVDPTPTLALGLARAKVGLGQWVEAGEIYRRILQGGAAHGAPPSYTVGSAQKELAALESRVPALIVNVTGSAKRLVIDGADVPLAALGTRHPVDPGSHVVRAEGEGQAAARATVTVAESTVETVTLTLEPVPHPAPTLPVVLPPPPAPVEPPPPGGNLRLKLGFVGMGVGGAGLIVGTVAGALAIQAHSELTAHCSGSRCPPGEWGTVDRYSLLSSLSTAGLLVGSALAVAGVVLVTTAPAATPSATGKVWLSPVISPTYAGLAGTF